MTRYEAIKIGEYKTGIFIQPSNSEIESRAETMSRKLDPRCKLATYLDHSFHVELKSNGVHRNYLLWQLISDFTSQGWEPFSTSFFNGGGDEVIYLRRRLDD